MAGSAISLCLWRHSAAMATSRWCAMGAPQRSSGASLPRGRPKLRKPAGPGWPGMQRKDRGSAQ